MTEQITTTSDAFASRLAQAMREAGYDQRSLARAVGAHYNVVLKWTKGSYLPRAGHLVPLAQTLRVSVDWLLSGGPLPSDEGTTRRSTAAVEVSEELAELAGDLERLARRARRVAKADG